MPAMTTSPPDSHDSPAADLLASARAIADQLTAWRRHLHQHPELSRQEEQTARYVAGQLRAMGYEPVERIGGTWGLTADLRVGAPAKDDVPFIALRADMDALPITEATGLPFCSQTPGVMHACGHDAHMAMLLGAAKLLQQRRASLRHSVRFIFQPAEERPPGGAATLIDAGVLDNVAAVFGLHIWSELPLGTLGSRPGPFMAGVDDLQITVTGRGGHAAIPHQAVDAVLAAAEIVTALQSVVARAIAPSDSAVVSVTQFHAGSANNVLPATAQLGGTIRTFDAAVRGAVVGRIRQIAIGIAQAHGASADVQITPGSAPLINNETVLSRAWAAARKLGVRGDDLLDLPPQGGSEDFACYAARVPAAFVFLGARPAAPAMYFPHHHPHFDIDEAALPLGAALHAQFALDS
jgi:amidohydrolase